jgi:hypothetical protein
MGSRQLPLSIYDFCSEFENPTLSQTTKVEFFQIKDISQRLLYFIASCIRLNTPHGENTVVGLVRHRIRGNFTRRGLYRVYIMCDTLWPVILAVSIESEWQCLSHCIDLEP